MPDRVPTNSRKTDRISLGLGPVWRRGLAAFSLWKRSHKPDSWARPWKMIQRVHGPRSGDTAQALIIDDDPDIAPLVKIALAPYSIAGEDVQDAATALARLRAQHYDLVILDLAMDGLNGFDILLTLKKRTRFRSIPVIVLTGNGSDESLARSFGYGADDFVIKPFKPSDLGMRAYRLLDPLMAR